MGTEIKVASTELHALNKAVSKSDYETVNNLLDKNPELVNQYVPPTYESPLALVLNKKHIDYKMLEILVTHGVAFDYPVNHHKELPIELACKNHDLQLCRFLMNHGAFISGRAPHFLLVHSTDIKYLSENKIKNAYQIIQLMGGIEVVSLTTDSEGKTFAERAINSQLINRFGGIVRYDYMRLLLAANVAPNAKSTGKLGVLIEEITDKYTAKEQYDRDNLKDSISLFYMTGSELIPSRKIPDHPTDEMIHDNEQDSPPTGFYR